MIDNATTFSLLSPTAAMNFTVHSIANSGYTMLQRFYEDAGNYRTAFEQWRAPLIERDRQEVIETRNNNAQGSGDVIPEIRSDLNVSISDGILPSESPQQEDHTDEKKPS